MDFLEQVPLMLVLGAGMLTFLSPCGYLLIPAYISHRLGKKVTVLRSVGGGLTAVLGIFIVLGSLGIMIGIVSPFIKSLVPHLTLISGIMIIIMGLCKLINFRISFTGVSKLNSLLSFGGLLTYGIAYAFAASGCTFPIFLTVILYASLFPGLGGLITMLTYGTGVAIPLIISSVLVSRVDYTNMRSIGNILSKIHAGSAIFIIFAGIYLIAFYYVNVLN